MNFSAKLRLYFHICKSFLDKLLKKLWTPYISFSLHVSSSCSSMPSLGAEKKKPLQQLSEERRNFIQNSLDQWCMDLGYKDCNVNMLTLSRTLCISKNELSLFFDQYLHSNFRIWLSDIRLNAAKKMMLECPDYSNDIISAECGFSCRTHLYRIFKTKEGCSPTEWRDFQSTDAAQNDSNGA